MAIFRTFEKTAFMTLTTESILLIVFGSVAVFLLLCMLMLYLYSLNKMERISPFETDEFP